MTKAEGNCGLCEHRLDHAWDLYRINRFFSEEFEEHNVFETA